MVKPLRGSSIIAGVAIAGATWACGEAGEGRRASGADTIQVAVAANFAAAHDTLAQRFRDATGIAVVSILGSTGQLYAQIVNGAPIDVFLSADRERPAALERDGVAISGSRFTYAEGRLAVYAPFRESIIDSPAKLVAADVRHIAIANPETAPYGAAAMEVLTRWGIVRRVSERLVRGESIAQTLQFVETGAAEAGFVALSQVIRADGTKYWIVPDSLHAPIAQDVVLLARTEARRRDAAQRYLAFLRSEDARRLIESFGYTVRDPVTTANERR